MSVPLFLEYEAVLSRPTHLQEAGLTLRGVAAFLDLLATHVSEVKVHYIWRPQLADVADEMVLETAINGRASHIVTFNDRHFEPAKRFGIELSDPATVIRWLR